MSFGSPLMLSTLLVVPALLSWLTVITRRAGRDGSPTRTFAPAFRS